MNNGILEKDVREFADSFNLYEQLRDKTILVTGATGLIGSVLIKCLIALDAKYNLNLRIIAPVRNIEKAQAIFHKELKEIELQRIEDVTKCEIESDVDYMIHLANPTASNYFAECPVETLNTTYQGTASMLELAKKKNVQSFVYVSSLEVYGTNLEDILISEDFQGYVNPIVSRSSYNIGKRASECLCHAYSAEYGVPVKIARLTQTFGAGVNYNDKRVFAQFARSVIENKNIELQTSGETSRMYCYTTDAVSALLYLLIKGVDGEAYNVANKDTYISILDMALFLKEKFNNDIEVTFVKKDFIGYAPQTKLKLDTSKIDNLGWYPKVDLEQMYERMIKSLC